MKLLTNEGGDVRLALPDWNRVFRGRDAGANLRRAQSEFDCFRRALRIQFAVIHALMLREVKTRYGKHSLGYLWAFGEPAIYLTFWIGLHGAIWGAMHFGMKTPIFMGTGIIPYFFFKDVNAFVQSGLSGNRALMQFPQVKPIDVLVARFLLESASILSVGTIILGFGLLAGILPVPNDFLSVMWASVSLLVLGFSYGSLNASLLNTWPTYSKFTYPINSILFFSSGVFYPFSLMPRSWRDILWFNPIHHGIEAFRAGWVADYTSPERADSLSYLFLCSSIMFILAMLIERSTRIQREED